MTRRAATLALIGLGSIQPSLAFAQSGAFADFEGDETFVFVDDKGKVKGEYIDPRTRTVRWFARDLVVPGNGGLTLEVGRTSSDNPLYLYFGTRDWDLDIPRIVKHVFPGSGGGGGVCENPELPYS